MSSDGRTPNGVVDNLVDDNSVVDESTESTQTSSTEFHRRALDYMPAALLVVAEDGTILYGNKTLTQLTGHTFRAGDGTNVMEYVHPDDHEWLIDAFVGVTRSIHAGTAVHGMPIVNSDAELADPTPWASISFRMLTATGETLPVEVTGLSGLHDPVIGGILYDVRAARGEELLRRVFTGLAKSEPVTDLLRMVLDMISLPPLNMDAIVLEPMPDGTFKPVVSTSPELYTALATQSASAPWLEQSFTPAYLDVELVHSELGDALRSLGYRDLWHISVASSMMSTTYRIVVCSRERQIPATGSRFRIQRASELAGVVLFRAQADELLSHAANHDALTGLPNRSGFYADINESLQVSSIAVLYIDIDDLKPINDEYGHQAGDVVLQRTADRIRSITRAGDHAARLGGDEFAVVLGTNNQASGLVIEYTQRIADRLLAAIAEPIDIDGSSVSVSASIGLVHSEDPAQVDQLLSNADAAMYEAKRAGGNQHRVALTG